MKATLSIETLRKAMELFNKPAKVSCWTAYCKNGHKLLGLYATADRCYICFASIEELKLITVNGKELNDQS